MPQLLENCQAVFESALLSSLAVPEVLERGTAMVSTYEDVLSRSENRFSHRLMLSTILTSAHCTVHDGWLEVKRLIEDDIEHESGYRRLVSKLCMSCPSNLSSSLQIHRPSLGETASP